MPEATQTSGGGKCPRSSSGSVSESNLGLGFKDSSRVLSSYLHVVQRHLLAQPFLAKLQCRLDLPTLGLDSALFKQTSELVVQ